MDVTPSYRPRVSRETRLLLTTALAAAAALWILARLRFPDLPPSPNPVPPLLSQLVAPPSFDTLASEVVRVQSRLQPSLIAFTASVHGAGSANGSTVHVAGLRFRDDLTIAVLPSGRSWAMEGLGGAIATDPASGLIVVRVPVQPLVPSLSQRASARFDRPQYLMVTDVSTERVGLRPVFVASLAQQATALWSQPLWVIPPHSELAVGSFLFTTAGELMGAVIAYAGQRWIVSSATLLVEADRLASHPIAPAADIGVQVQSLSPSLSTATGTKVGVIVTWVDPNSAAAGLLATGDVIESSDGQTVLSPEHWRVQLARLSAGRVLALRVRRAKEERDISVRVPAPTQPVTETSVLGLRMRRAPRVGTEVLAVDPGSAGARGGLVRGDTITLIGDISAPAPAQVARTFSAASQGTPIVVGVTRGATHLVTTLTR